MRSSKGPATAVPDCATGLPDASLMRRRGRERERRWLRRPRALDCRMDENRIRASPARWPRLRRASRWAEEADSRHRVEEEAKAAAAADRDGDVDNNVYTSEDEGTENYGHDGYHVVRPGDNFKQGAYVMQSKLGWGHFSTAWLTWDTAHSVRAHHPLTSP
ncbi:Protein kinase dsk1 [Hordeum vulgare]|nr:Protein kinase dsk1 [Hordeum vulgare]